MFVPERRTQRTQDSVPSVVYVTCVQRSSIRLVRNSGGKVTLTRRNIRHSSTQKVRKNIFLS